MTIKCICSILFDLSESYKNTLFKDLLMKIIEVKITKNCLKNVIFVTIMFLTRSLNNFILGDADRPNSITQILFYPGIYLYIKANNIE